MKEKSLLQELESKFPQLEGKAVIQRARRIFVDVPHDSFYEVFDFSVKNLGCTMLCTLTGIDEDVMLAVIYNLGRDDGILINLIVRVPKEAPILKSVSSYFPNAVLYERELVDLFGMKVEGLPEGYRYPLPDNWPEGQFPLRKDWKQNHDNAGKEVQSDV